MKTIDVRNLLKDSILRFGLTVLFVASLSIGEVQSRSSFFDFNYIFKCIPSDSIAPGQDVVSIALDKIGSKYSTGSQGPSRFDCSGLVNYAFKFFGITIPRSSGGIYQKGKKINRTEIKRGDLIAFEKNNRISHVSLIESIKDGDIFVVHSTNSRGVVLENIDRSHYWKKYVFHFVRIVD